MPERMSHVTGMHIHVRGWKSLKLTFPIRKSEYCCAAAIFGYSMVLLIRDDMFASSHGYDRMLAMASQSVWQWMLFLTGSVRIAILLINGSWEHSPRARAATAYLSCFAWSSLFIGTVGNFGFNFVSFLTFFVLDALNGRQALLETAVSDGLRQVEKKKKIGT